MFRLTRASVPVLRRAVAQGPRRTFRTQTPLQAGVSMPRPDPGTFGVPSQFYKTFLSSNKRYVTLIIVAGIVGGTIFDNMWENIWASANAGKLYKDVIPSQFPNLPPGTEPDEDEEDEE